MKRQRSQSVASVARPDAGAGRTAAGFAFLIFFVALAVRILHVWQIRSAPFFSMLMGDARGYDAWAQRIAGGEWMGQDVFYQAPLYPYFLGAIYTVAGHDLLAVRIAQAVVGSASCVLLGLAAGRLFSRPAGLLAGLGLALYAPAIFFDSLIQKSVLDVFFVCLAIWVMSRIVEPPASSATGTVRAASFFLLGIAMGGLALTRENAMVLIAAVMLWIAVGAGIAFPSIAGSTSGRSPGTKTKLIAAGLFAAGLALVLGPVALRNYAVGGGFYITTSQFGTNFYIGNNPRSDGTYMSLRYGRGAPEYERQDATELAQLALGRTLTPAEVSGYWTDRALSFITSQPGAWLRLVGRKAMLLVNADEMLDTESQETYAEWSLPLRASGWIGHFGILMPLASLGMWLAWPDRRRLWIFYVMTLAYAASVVMFYVFARYRFPLVPFLMLFASAGIVVITKKLSSGELEIADTQAPAAMPSRGQANPRRGISVSTRRGWGPGASEKKLAWTAVTALTLTVIIANWPILSKATMRAVTENNLGNAFQEEGRLDEAIAHYRRSLTFDPGYAPAYNNMGAALRASGRVDDAVASYEKALAARSDYPDAHYNLANALLSQDKPDAAAEHFRIALKSIPDSAGARNNLGIALAAKGQWPEAVAEFRAALASDPASARTHRNLGNALTAMGDKPEGLAFLKRAVELDPADAESHYDLGVELLGLDQLKEAVVEFEAAIRLNPRSAPAHNNLGIALASLGRVDDAVAHFQQALAIQPDFADARKNLAIAAAQRR